MAGFFLDVGLPYQQSNPAADHQAEKKSVSNTTSHKKAPEKIRGLL
jgi:hypothetical protein